METQLKKKGVAFNEYTLEVPGAYRIDQIIKSISNENIAAFKKADDFKKFFQQDILPGLVDLLTRLAVPPAGKTSFLVVKRNKYITVATANIAYFYVKYESPVMTCFDGQEYFVNHSLDHIQNLLNEMQFFRINRQYLVNFNAVKEVEHYFARKLLVNLNVPASDKLVVSKGKVRDFLQWLENR